MKLSGKIALVTGSARGIGKAIAEGFAREGANVIVHGRSAKLVDRLAKELSGTPIVADLSDSASCLELAKTIRNQFGKIEIIVNNAGAEEIMPVGEIDQATMERLFQVNVMAPVRIVETLLPLLTAAKAASVINVTSIHQSIPYPHNCVYSMTKAALAMYSQTAAIELAKHNIRVNNLAPGAVETDINREVIAEMKEEFAEWIPAGRCAQADEMVGPAVFLASEDSSYVTGTTLYADGGYSQNLVRYRPEKG